MRYLRELVAFCTVLSGTRLGQGPLRAAKFTLPNGLRVVVNEDHSVPIVAVDLWYHVGSADERALQAGFAHTCEHAFSTGTRHMSGPANVFLQSIGAYSGTATNAWATTTPDYTQFYETVPRPQLDTVLWYEADRMRAPFARVDSMTFTATREVVRQERNQRVDNRPFGEARDFMRAAMYQAGNPYRESDLPPMAALDAAGRAAVLDFCRPYYVPSNVVLALSGDVSVDGALALVSKYFGKIPRGKAPTRPSAARSPLAREQRLVLTDSRAAVSSLYIGWPGVGFSHPDKMPLYALAGVLSGRKYGFDGFGRLSRALIDEKHLATAVRAQLYDAEDAGDFIIEISPREGTSLTAIELTVDSVLASMRDALIDKSELVAFDRLNSVSALTSIQARAQRADTLAQSELWARDLNAYAKQIASVQRITPEDIRRVARQYLTSNRVVMSLVPATKIGERSRPELPYVDVTPPAARKVVP